MRTGVILAVLVLIGFMPLAFAQAGGIDIPALKEGIAQRVNQYRADNGLNTWQYDPGIEGIAAQHSRDQIERNYLSHYTQGTNIGPGLRASMGGYGICGEPAAIAQYRQTGELIQVYQAKVAEYERYKAEVEPRINQGLAPNTQELYDELVRRSSELDVMRADVNTRIDKVNADIDYGKIGIGFAENLVEFQGFSTVTSDRLISDSISNWINSPDHKAVLDWYGGKMGIGISNNNDRLVITLDIC